MESSSSALRWVTANSAKSCALTSTLLELGFVLRRVDTSLDDQRPAQALHLDQRLLQLGGGLCADTVAVHRRREADEIDVLDPGRRARILLCHLFELDPVQAAVDEHDEHDRQPACGGQPDL